MARAIQFMPEHVDLGNGLYKCTYCNEFVWEDRHLHVRTATQGEGMTVGELIRQLAEFPQDIEVEIEGSSAREKDMPVTGAEWNTAGQRSWVTITDYHPHGYRNA